MTSIQATDPWAKSGVMLRATTDPGSPYYAAYITKGNGLAVQARTAQGVAAIGVASVAGVPPEYLQISRSGTSFTVSTSSDGVTWTAVPGSTLVRSQSERLAAGGSGGELPSGRRVVDGGVQRPDRHGGTLTWSRTEWDRPAATLLAH